MPEEPSHAALSGELFAATWTYKSGCVDTIEPARLVMATTSLYYRFIMFVERIECFIEHRIHQRRVGSCYIDQLTTWPSKQSITATDRLFQRGTP
jgi:hypothetical protein